MSTVAVFRHDLLTIRRSKLFWTVLVLCPSLVAGSFFAVTVSTPVDSRMAIFSIMGVVLPVLIFVPLLALVSACLTVASERESGTLRFLLGFPNNRREVLLGKFLARASLVAGGLVIGFTLVATQSILFFEEPHLVTIGLVALLTMLLTTAYISLAVGLSAVASSQMRAITAAISSYVVWAFFWIPSVPSSLPSFVANHVDPSASTQSLVDVVSPSMAYVHSLQLLGSTPEKLMESLASGPQLVPASLAVGSLVVWSVVPLVLGYWWFSSVEIG